MYKTLTIENYRGLRHLHFPRLARLNLLAGKNNTGKTSVLEALHIHAGIRDWRWVLRETEDTPVRRRHVLERGENAPSLSFLNSLFFDFEDNTPITLTALGEGINRFAEIILAMHDATGGSASWGGFIFLPGSIQSAARGY